MRISKLIYKRIILKISGEIFQGSKKFGIKISTLNRIAKDIKKLSRLKMQIGVVIGGGNLFRGLSLVKDGINRVVSDQIGMLSTIINGLAFQETLNRVHIKNELMSSLFVYGICEQYNCKKAINFLSRNIIVILSAGTGNPLFTTDSAACLRGIETESDAILKATKVDGVYSSDPLKNSNAKFYKKLTYSEAIKKNLKIMDSTAFTIAKDYNMPVHIFNVNKKDALFRIVLGKNEGTLIHC
ncbi:uridylate kinase [Candidatus Riesia sp. GBBU]|nr:uridylate kinase [Candidatus Riesia sp. GBBU]